MIYIYFCIILCCIEYVLEEPKDPKKDKIIGLSQVEDFLKDLEDKIVS